MASVPAIIYVIPCVIIAGLGSAQLSVQSLDIVGDFSYVVVNHDNGDVYLAVNETIIVGEPRFTLYTLDDNLNIHVSVEIFQSIRFMTIDYQQNAIIVCYTGSTSCQLFDLPNLASDAEAYSSAACVISDYRQQTACTPTGIDAAAFIGAGPNNRDVFYVATTPQLKEVCETPRVASRELLPGSFLNVVNQNKTGLFLSNFSAIFPEIPISEDAIVYGFSYNGYTYFVGSFQRDKGQSEARISRVSQSDSTYASYMESALYCNRQGEGLFTKSVSWALMTKISRGLARNYDGYEENEDILYYVVQSSVLCFVRMRDIDAAFERVVQACLNGSTVASVAPDIEEIQCPVPAKALVDYPDIQEVLHGIDVPYRTPIAAIDPIIGDNIMAVYDMRQAVIVGSGEHDVIIYHDGTGNGGYNMKIITPELIHREFPDDQFTYFCSPMEQHFRTHPYGAHLYTFTVGPEFSRTQESTFPALTRVEKVLLENCTSPNCNSCLDSTFCGWCSKKKKVPTATLR